jgi:acyl-CoA thioesterase I
MAMGVGAAMRYPRLGRGLAWGGVVLAVLSAVPIHPAAYVSLLLVMTAWQISVRRSLKVRRGATIGVLVAALPSRDYPEAIVQRDAAVFVVGDSISAGLGRSDETTWPRLLAERLRLNVSNLARPGARLADGVSQARSIPGGPSTVLVELGGNDLLGGTSAARFAADLESLLEALAAENRQVLMFELPLLPLQNTFGRIQWKVCKRHGVTLLPRSILAGALALPGNATDGLHLSAQGHRWLAGRLAATWDGTLSGPRPGPGSAP